MLVSLRLIESFYNVLMNSFLLLALDEFSFFLSFLDKIVLSLNIAIVRDLVVLKGDVAEVREQEEVFSEVTEEV